MVNKHTCVGLNSCCQCADCLAFCIRIAATAGVDYRIVPEHLTFTPGQRAMDGSMQCTTVFILDDEVIGAWYLFVMRYELGEYQ